MSDRVFVSYRRADAGDDALRLASLLGRRLGEDRVFFDVESLRPGEPWLDRIHEVIAGCGVMLVVIGPSWTAEELTGHMRLDDVEDIVRAEVAEGLRSSATVIPILVGGASMPALGSLPDELLGLLDAHGATISDDRWSYDAEQVLRRVEELVDRQSPVTGRSTVPLGTAPGLVGREALIGHLRELVRGHRLVTLTGAGGSGKTVLARELLRSAGPETESLFVDLTAAKSAPQIYPAVADELGIRELPAGDEAGAIARRLGGGSRLVVLDNCEHLVNAVVGLVSEILATCPQLVVIATSREPLAVEGEAVVMVPPLGVPDSSDDLSVFAQVPAVRLFARRAHMADPSFELTEHEAPAVAEICRRVDGIPLAIELAAARIRSMDVHTIADRLGSRIDVLEGRRGGDPRHGAMTDTLDWSYGLLEPEQAAAFDRMAVFRGGFDIDAASALCADLDPLQEIPALVDRSLLAFEAGVGVRRYRMLEPVRQYAMTHLRPVDRDRWSDGHAAWFADLVERAEPEVRGADQLRWHRRLRADAANIRAALAWTSTRGDAETFGRLVAGQWWSWRGTLREAGEWATVAVDLADRMSTATKGSALYCAAFWSSYLPSGGQVRDLAERAISALRDAGDQARMTQLACMALDREGRTDEAIRVAEQAAERARSEGNIWWSGRLIEQCGAVAGWSGDLSASAEWFREALSVYEQIGDRHACLSVTSYLGELAAASGDLDVAGRLVTDALVSVDEELSPSDHASLLWALGDVERERAEHEAAGAHYREAFEIVWRSGFTGLLPEVLHRWAALELVRGLPRSAVVVLGAADDLAGGSGRLEDLGAGAGFGDLSPPWRIRDEAAKHLSTDDLHAAWSEGIGTRLDAMPHLVDTLV